MSNGSELKSKSAQALRAAGYLPLPRLWVKEEEMGLIRYMAEKHADDVNRIRAAANGTPEMTDEERKRQEMNAAWEQMKRGR